MAIRAKRNPKDVLGRRSRELREARGMSQAEVAQRSGLERADISRIETGRLTNPKRRSIEALAAALGVKPGRLLDA